MTETFKILLRYLKHSKGRIIHPRRPGSRRMRLDLRINNFNEDTGRISITFIGGKSLGLPLHFWMFEKVINRLSSVDSFVPVGARLTPPYIRGSLEEAIWDGESSPYKAAPHVCDILFDADLVEYGWALNAESGRRVQGAKLKQNADIGAISSQN